MPSNQIRREFLGWERPALAEAALRLAARYRDGDALDLGHVIVVAPGQRFSHRNRKILGDQMEFLLLGVPKSSRMHLGA